jgi:hypothetical protein
MQAGRVTSCFVPSAATRRQGINHTESWSSVTSTSSDHNNGDDGGINEKSDGGSIIVATGAAIHRYDLIHDKWYDMPSLIFERWYPNVVYINNAIYILGGIHHGNNNNRANRPIDTIERFIIPSSNWSVVAPNVKSDDGNGGGGWEVDHNWRVPREYLADFHVVTSRTHLILSGGHYHNQPKDELNNDYAVHRAVINSSWRYSTTATRTRGHDFLDTITPDDPNDLAYQIHQGSMRTNEIWCIPLHDLRHHQWRRLPNLVHLKHDDYIPLVVDID